MSALIAAEGGRRALIIASKAGKKASIKSEELFQYDFLGLTQKLVIYFVFAYVIAKIFEGIIFGQGLLLQFVALFGLKLPQSLPEPIVNFFRDGIKGFRYWDFVKMLAILLVVLELNNYLEQRKRLNEAPSPMTLGVFTVILTGLTLITFPEIWTRIKELRAMSQATPPTNDEGTGNTRTREFR